MPKRIEVYLTRQILSAYDGGKKVFVFDCATGDAQHPTDPGSFHIFRKDRFHVSAIYHVPMNYAMFFTRDGKAIHMSHLVGPISLLKSLGANYFGSHGCVRLAESDARSLFNWAPTGTLVHVLP